MGRMVSSRPSRSRREGARLESDRGAATQGAQRIANTFPDVLERPKGEPTH